MNWSKMSSVAGVLLAAAASVASSHPGAEEDSYDWKLEDSVSGLTTLSPDVESTTVHIKTTSTVFTSTLTLGLFLDPVPAYDGAAEQRPIVLFTDIVEPNADRTLPAPLRMTPAPDSATFGPPPSDGYEQSIRMDVPAGSMERELVIRFAWTSPNSQDFSARPLAPRRPTTIRWHAGVRVEGNGSPPPGAAVDINLAQ